MPVATPRLRRANAGAAYPFRQRPRAERGKCPQPHRGKACVLIASFEQGPAKTAVFVHHLLRSPQPAARLPFHVQPAAVSSGCGPSQARLGRSYPGQGRRPFHRKKGKKCLSALGNHTQIHSALWAGSCEDGCFCSPSLAPVAQATALLHAHAAYRTPHAFPLLYTRRMRYATPRHSLAMQSKAHALQPSPYQGEQREARSGPSAAMARIAHPLRQRLRGR